jgi:hypothetical protein
MRKLLLIILLSLTLFGCSSKRTIIIDEVVQSEKKLKQLRSSEIFSYSKWLPGEAPPAYRKWNKSILIIVKTKKVEEGLQKQRHEMLNRFLDSVDNGLDILIVQDGMLVLPDAQKNLRMIIPNQLSNAYIMEEAAAKELYGTPARRINLIINTYNEKTNDLENEKYLNFIGAIQNSSTFSYFTVIKAKNLNTGMTKEICTKGNFVMGALHKELNIDYDIKGEQKVFDFARSKRNRYFEFKNIEALENISFFDYNEKLVRKIQTEYNFDKAIEIIERNKEFSIQLSDDEMKAFAHVLFNNGFLTGENSCWGGTLEYVNKKGDAK